MTCGENFIGQHTYKYQAVHIGKGNLKNETEPCYSYQRLFGNLPALYGDVLQLDDCEFGISELAAMARSRWLGYLN